MNNGHQALSRLVLLSGNVNLRRIQKWHACEYQYYMYQVDNGLQVHTGTSTSTACSTQAKYYM